MCRNQGLLCCCPVGACTPLHPAWLGRFAGARSPVSWDQGPHWGHLLGQHFFILGTTFLFKRRTREVGEGDLEVKKRGCCRAGGATCRQGKARHPPRHSQCGATGRPGAAPSPGQSWLQPVPGTPPCGDSGCWGKVPLPGGEREPRASAQTVGRQQESW